MLRFSRRVLQPGLPHLWQGVSMSFMGILAAAAVLGGFLRDQGFEEMVRRSVAAKTKGRAGFQRMAMLPDGTLRLIRFTHQAIGSFPEIGPWTAEEAHLSVGLFSWPPAVKSVRLVGMGRVPVNLDPRRAVGGPPPDLPDYPLSFEGADLDVQVPFLASLPLTGCRGSLTDSDRGLRAEIETSRLGKHEFPLRVKIDPGPRVQIESGGIDLEGPGAYLIGGASWAAALTGTLKVNHGACVGWPPEETDLALTMDQVGLRAGLNPLNPWWVHNGPQGMLSCHLKRDRVEFAFHEGPGSSWFIESAAGRWEIASSLRGAVRWSPAGADGLPAIEGAQVQGTFGKGWDLVASLERDGTGTLEARWRLTPRAAPPGGKDAPLWEVLGEWRQREGAWGSGEFHVRARALGLVFPLAEGREAKVSGALALDGETGRLGIPHSIRWRLTDGHAVAGDPSAAGMELTGVQCSGSVWTDLPQVRVEGRIEGLRLLAGGHLTDYSRESAALRATVEAPGLHGLLAGLPCALSASIEAPGGWAIRLGRAGPAGPAYALTIENLPIALLPGRERLGTKVRWGPQSRCDAQAGFVYDGDRWTVKQRLRLKGIEVGDPQGGLQLEDVEVELSR